MFGVRWQEFGTGDRVVTKQKDFDTAEAREKFVDRLVEKANFWRVCGYSDPIVAEEVK